MDAGLPRGTMTFLFTDIEGSTELSRRHGAAYGDVRAEHRRVLREVFAAHRGCEIDAEGDGFFIGFEQASDAVAAAVAAQRVLVETGMVRVRIGLHTTEPHVHSEGYVGVGVSRAARICAAAHGGQIVLSQATAGIVEDNQLLDVRLRDLGEHFLKDIPLPQRLFQLDSDGLQSDFPPLARRSGRARQPPCLPSTSPAGVGCSPSWAMTARPPPPRNTTALSRRSHIGTTASR